MAIIAMVNNESTDQTTDSNSTQPSDNFSCPRPSVTNPITNETTHHTPKVLPGPKYDWNPKMQGRG